MSDDRSRGQGFANEKAGIFWVKSNQACSGDWQATWFRDERTRSRP